MIVREDEQKIHKIHQTMAFAVNGDCHLIKNYVDDETNKIVEGREEILFDANATIRRYYRSNNPIYIDNSFGVLGGIGYEIERSLPASADSNRKRKSRGQS